MGVDDSVRVLIVDDSESARSALAAVVAATSGFTLVGSSESGFQALRLLPDLEPDLVLLDMRMPGLSGPETARRISDTRPETVVTLVSADSTPEVVGSCGAAAFLPKSEVTPEALRQLWTATRADAAALRGETQQLRRNTRALREEAQALRAEAEQQATRSKRIPRPPR